MEKFLINTIFEDDSIPRYNHFGIHPVTASMYGHTADEIVLVTMYKAEDQTVPQFNSNDLKPDYWGWYDFGQERFTLIHPKYFLLNMCFFAGIKASEDAGEGKAYRLLIEEIVNHI